MSRPARADFDLAALRANYAHAKAVHGGKVAATLKANAYGHGAVECARALAGQADAFAVAFAQEAMELREAGLTEPILVLEGAFGMDDVALAQRHGLWLVVHQEEQLRMLESLQDRGGGASVHAWLKIDTGMHRAGVAPGQARALWQRLAACDKVAGITLMTHLASADEPGNPMTGRQLAVFADATQGLPGPRSIANSAGVLGWKGAHQDWARPGIMLYGADPRGMPSDVLQPVMRLASEVFVERWLAPGEALGYGGSFVADRPARGAGGHGLCRRLPARRALGHAGGGRWPPDPHHRARGHGHAHCRSDRPARGRAGGAGRAVGKPGEREPGGCCCRDHCL